MKEIKLTRGQVSIVDDEDYEYLNYWKWSLNKSKNNSYAARAVVVDGVYLNIKMHRLIMGLKKGDKRQVDHINHNGLDNRKENLRVCTKSENLMNKKLQVGRKSKYKGVSIFSRKRFNKTKQMWTTYSYWKGYISKDKIRFNLGSFKTEIDAALAYNEAAIKYFGDFAYLNIIE